MLNKDKKRDVWLAKYGWRYKALAKWLETHSAPQAEKSTISQLKSVSIAFGENIAKRLSEEHGITGIYERPSSVPEYGDNFDGFVHVYGKVPLISWVQAGAWCDSNVSFEPGDAEEWLLCAVPHGKHTFALRVRGDSMDSKDGYREGEIIFVDPEIESAPNDDVVVRVGTNHTFKRLRQDENGLYLWALNEHWNPRMQHLEGDFHICGKVILSQMKR